MVTSLNPFGVREVSKQEIKANVLSLLSLNPFGVREVSKQSMTTPLHGMSVLIPLESGKFLNLGQAQYPNERQS